MRLLLDTHTFLWFIDGNANLSTSTRALIEDMANEVFLSVASLWEMAIKVSLRKLQLEHPFEILMPEQLSLNGIELLGITVSHVANVAVLPFHHRDPFDRLLIAQSLAERMPIVSRDPAFDSYPVTRLW
jgi:PIN domain nuclease of toxin-antitoxin system